MRRRAWFAVALCCLLGLLSWGVSSRLGKATVASKVKDRLKLSEIHLTEKEPGKYEGSGTGTDGTTYTIRATQTEHELRWEYEDSKGNRGSGVERESRSR
jgi:hypothetical protein